MTHVPDSASWTALGNPRRDHYRLSSAAVDMTRPTAAISPISIPAQPERIVIDANKTALIVVDMQNDFCSRGGWMDSLGADITPVRKLYEPINKAMKALRAERIPIVWVNWGVRADRANLSPVTRYPFNRVGCGVGLADPSKGHAGGSNAPSGILERGSWGAAVVDDLASQPADIFVDKHRISGFWDTPLDSILRNLSVKTLLFAGVNADHCVLATLMDANFHGYDTVLIEDCTATSSPDFCLQATLFNIRFCFGFTISSTDLVTALSTVPETPGRQRNGAEGG
jgi:ureidoacrylate peracid hydrolase